MNDESTIIEPTPFTRAEERRGRRSFKLRPLPTALGVLFVLLALATAFTFAARAVRFVVKPQPETFRITSGFFTWQLGERYLMLPGAYDIRATLQGYKILDQHVKVGTGSDQDFTFTMRKLPGILDVTTMPDTHPDVFVDKKKVGKAPLRLSAIEAGSHAIRIVPERYLPYEAKIDIKGKRIEQRIDAQLKPAWANVSVTSLPTGASISIDGKASGETPANIEVLQGPHRVEIQKHDYQSWQGTIDVVAGQDQTLPRVALVRSDGKIDVVTTPPGANVTIGGRYRGQSPIEVTIAPGTAYSVLLSKVGYAPLKRHVSVQPEQTVKLREQLHPVTGTLSLHVTPAGGQLFVDDKAMGEPSRRLVLTARRHRLKIVKAGYATYETTVTPQPGFAQQLNVSLETKEQAKMAAIPAEIETHSGIKLKLIVPGELTMGAGRREPGRRANEIIKHVKLTKLYYLGIDEITNAQYKLYDPGHNSGILGQATLNNENRPVVNVSWSDAAQFCNWLSNQEGLPDAYRKKNGKWVAVSPMNNGYRLPTEAEWAWAARYAAGPHPTRFPWGDDMPPKKVDANYADESARDMVPYIIEGYDDHYRGPSPVGSFPPNAFGIYDLAGNVSEWINDYYSVETPKGILVDPLGPSTGEYHVIRGSNYTNGRYSELRWTYRNYGNKANPETGFRVARYLK